MNRRLCAFSRQGIDSSVWLAIFLALGSTACGGSTLAASPKTGTPELVAAPRPVQSEEEAPDFPAEPEAASVSVATDRSQGADAYIALGFPPLTEAWLPADYSAAQAAMAKLTGSARTELPRFRSESSGAVFSKLSSTDAFETLNDEAIPLQERLARSQQYLAVLPQLLAHYHTPTASGASFPAEKAELVGALLAVLPKSLALIGEALRQNPKRTELAKALVQARTVATAVLAGAFSMLGERNHYRLVDRRRLVAHLLQFGPGIQRHLSASQRASLGQSLERVDPIGIEAEVAELRSAFSQTTDERNTNATKPEAQ